MAAKRKVLLIDRIHPEGEDLVRQHPDLDLEVLVAPDETTLLERLGTVEAIMVRNALLPERVLAAAPRLSVISRHGVGCDNIAVAAATARGIPIAITADANAQSVAEHTLMMMLGLAKDVFWYHRKTAEDFNNARNQARAIDLGGRRVLVIGVGRIGRRVARLCRAFDMEVLGHDPYLSDAELTARDCRPVSDWRAVLPEVDVLAIHTPKTAETIGMVDAAALSALPDHALVLNCARGGLVQEAALEAALLAGSIGGAGIDVFDDEPPPQDHPLLALDKVIVSPHSAAATREGLRRMGLACARSVIDHFAGTLAPATLFNAEGLGLIQREKNIA